ncbi:unnamed protein product, partial [Notodromas monacha]
WRPIAPVGVQPDSRPRQPFPVADEPTPIDRADVGPVEFADHDTHDGGAHDHPQESVEKPQDSAHPEPEPESQPEPAAEPEADPESEPQPTASSSVTKPVGTGSDHSYAPKGDKALHAMDCADIVIGTARGAAHRIEDYYTRDRSTPREDAYWGFRSDITASFGVEEDGVTTIAFRRKLDASEPTDHSIVDDEMTVIWARGQEPGMYVHSPASGLEQGAASDPDFYRPDEIKYHGKKDQRGVISLNFYQEDAKEKTAADEEDSDICGGQFSYPRTCSGLSDCEYMAKWEYDEDTDKVKFTITSRHTKNRWTGIGFSKDTRMGQSDAVLGWIDRSGRAFIADMWIKGYTAPELDSNQDISDTSVVLEDGVVTVKFTRPRVSKDSQICIRSCRSGADVPGDSSDETGSKVRVTTARTTTTTTAKPQMMMDVELKFIDVGDDFKIPRKNSPEFNELSERVKRSVTSALTSVPGFEDVSVSDFEESEEKELIAKLVVTLDHDTVSKE